MPIIKRMFYCCYICRHKQKQKLPLTAQKLIPQGVIDITMSHREEKANLK